MSPSDPRSDPQKAEKDEPGRGRSAHAPSEIPQAGWRDILLRVWPAPMGERGAYMADTLGKRPK